MLINFYPPPIPQFPRRADEKPADYLRRQWIIGAWARSSWLERLVFAIVILLWWPTTILHAAYLAARLGPARARIYGKSPFKQFLEQLAMAWRWLIPPLWYYTFEFCDDAKRARAADYVHRVQMKPFIYHWLVDRVARKDRKYPFANKVYFSHLCRDNGLAASRVIALCGGRGIHFTKGLTEFPAVDLFIKIKNGRGGRGAEKWSYADGRYRNSDGRSFAKAEFTEYVRQRSRLEKRIVQYCLVNHSALSDINLGALATARIMTLRNERGGIEATHAVLRMPQRPGAPVDNIHAGGIAAPIDLKTGKLGRATDLGLRVTSRWHERHPETGAAILGRELPHWRAAIDLVCRAHDLIGDRVAVGWDVAILEDGPCLVEGNGKPDVDLMQRPHGLGLGNSRYGELVAFHLKAFLAGETANGRRPAQMQPAVGSSGR
jgi:Sugar-transfer associated ATP-grasp